MTEDGIDPVPRRPRLRIWLRRTLLALVILPPLAFGASNLWLANRGRTLLANRLEQRWGLETRIGGASWSPWHGLTLRHLEVAQPAPLRGDVDDPLLRVDTLRVTPVWHKLLKRQLSIGALEISGAKVALTVEMVAQLAQLEEPPAVMPLAMATPATLPSPPATTAVPDEIVAATPPAATVPPSARPAGPAGPATPAANPSAPSAPGEIAAALQPEAPPQPATPGQPTPTPPAPEQAQPPTAAESPPAVAEITRWAVFQEVDFQLIAASRHQILAEVAGFAGRVPFAGEPAKSTLAVNSVVFLGEPVLGAMRAGLAWQSPVVTLEPEDPDTLLAGLKLRWGARLALMEGLPAQLQIELPRQAVRLPTPDPAITAEAREAAARAMFLGRLLVPGTWQGELLAEAADIELKHSQRDLRFDRASTAVVLRGGTLSCLDVRLIGEELSLLGNGTLLADGRLAAALRLVAPRETVAPTLHRMFPDLSSAPACLELSTPQRVACDLSVAGTWQEPLLRIGADGAFHPLYPAVTPP